MRERIELLETLAEAEEDVRVASMEETFSGLREILKESNREEADRGQNGQ